MNTEIRLLDLWKSLSPEEIEDGCRCLLESTDTSGNKMRGIILEALATAMRFRPEFLRRRKPAENLPPLVKRIGTRDFERFRDDVIRAWLVARHRPMLVAFLEASGIPQKDGYVDGDPPAPAPSQFEAGISRILAQYKARDVGLYLGYLRLYGDDFWSALGEALSNKAVSIVELLNLVQAEIPPAQSPQTEEITEQPPLEDSDEFTTLDNWLIRTAVAAAFGESGAQTPEQVEDLVEEVVSLNAQRQHTLFHRGYFHALFQKEFVFHFPGENETRRLWYFTGVLFGLLRSSKSAEALKLLKENPDLVGQLYENRSVRCGNMLLPQLRPILWEAREFGICQRWVENQLSRVAKDGRINLIIQIHYDAASLVRRGQWAEAEGFLEFIDSFVRNSDDLPDGFAEWFLQANDRKRAQVLQLKGDFHGAEQLLKPITEIEDGEESANALSDLGLIQAGFRSLPAVLPVKDEIAIRSITDSLEKGRELFDKAATSAVASAANANFCLGLMELLGNNSPRKAADHLKASLGGMLKKEAAYSEGNLIQWNRFLLGLALLEGTESPDFQYAQDLVEQSTKAPVTFPIWLWQRAMQAAAVFDDPSLGQSIAEHILSKRAGEAYGAIWQSGMVRTSDSLRQTYLEWLRATQMPVSEKWNQFKAMLAAAIKQANITQAESILDEMEGIAFQGKSYRAEFLKLLQDDRNYSPAWSVENAEYARIKFHELDGDTADAVALLRSRFFQAKEQGGSAGFVDASAILDRMAGLGADQSDITHLMNLLPAETDTEAEEACPLAAGTPVYVVYIGGNETQSAYESEIRSELRTAYAGLRLDFYYPGWSSNWIDHFEKVRPMIFQSDAIVLSTMVRTQFGQHVRAACGSSRPWFPCTGRGKQSVKRSIEKAAKWAATRKMRG